MTLAEMMQQYELNRRALEDELADRCDVFSDIQPQLPLLRAAAAAVARDGQIVELGTRSGNSTCALLAGAAASRARVWSVDLERPNVPGWWPGLTYLWSSIVGSDLDEAVLAALPERIDLLFLDTSHLYDDTYRELEIYLPRMRPGGAVLCHDTRLDKDELGSYMGGVTLPGPQFPVATALDDFCHRAGLAWFETSGGYGLGRIEVPK